MLFMLFSIVRNFAQRTGCSIALNDFVIGSSLRLVKRDDVPSVGCFVDVGDDVAFFDESLLSPIEVAFDGFIEEFELQIIGIAGHYPNSVSFHFHFSFNVLIQCLYKSRLRCQPLLLVSVQRSTRSYSNKASESLHRALLIIHERRHNELI